MAAFQVFTYGRFWVFTEAMLQEFTAFERLPVTVTEADLLRDIQIHLPVNESDFLQSRRADSRSTQASTGSVF
jgi:hypothetical protein